MLTIDSNELVQFRGRAGGGFAPAGIARTVTNSGKDAAGYSVATIPAAPWLETGGGLGGELLPDESVVLLIGVTSEAAALAPGEYVATVRITSEPGGTAAGEVVVRLVVRGLRGMVGFGSRREI
ncbi:MAG: hypothetical protein IPM18_14085 [Phycisphaerales bacterium]|nr:hypothetical protein [Phycisphaerales bacterium]